MLHFEVYNKQFSGEGSSPLSNRSPAGRGTPLPHPTHLSGLSASTNAPSALDLSTLSPPKLKSGYIRPWSKVDDFCETRPYGILRSYCRIAYIHHWSRVWLIMLLWPNSINATWFTTRSATRFWTFDQRKIGLRLLLLKIWSQTWFQ